MSQTLEERMIECGYIPQELPLPGVVKRFQVKGKGSGNRSAWIMGIDENTAVFGDWISGNKFSWSANYGRKLSAYEQEQCRRNLEIATRKRDAELKAKNDAAQKVANQMYMTADDVITHNYLVKKNIIAPGVKESDGNLIIPIVDKDLELTSVQTINENGDKKFLPGGKIKGGFYPLNLGTKPVTVIAEGFATAASLLEWYYQDCTVVAAFSAGNLKLVASAWRDLLPENQIIIAGDNDRNSKANNGRKKAEEAAQYVGGIAVLPEFFDDEEGTDWNDRASIDFAHVWGEPL